MEKKDLKYYLNLPYTIILKRDPYSGYFVKIEELKGCISEGETQEEALRNIQEAFELWIETALKKNVKIPEPEICSGKFVLRVPKSLHRRLAAQAKLENVSLNQYIVYLLSENFAVSPIQKEIERAFECWAGFFSDSLKEKGKIPARLNMPYEDWSQPKWN